jgi:hypothetical protein
MFEPGDEAMTSTQTTTSTAPARRSEPARRAELLQKLSSEKRVLFEEIVALRKKIGPVGFDIVPMLSEIRDTDEDQPTVPIAG